MAQQLIDTGTTPGDGTGTSAREAGGMLNEMFTELYAAVNELGTASVQDVEYFATSSQGEKADTAVQPESLATVATTGSYNDLSGLPTLGTAAAAATGDFTPASHASATDNPHSVTASQVGLGNVDNTSDADKPISSLTQAALDGKAASTHSHAISDVTDLQDALDAKVGTDGGILLDVVITQEAYDLLDPKVATTRYNIVG